MYYFNLIAFICLFLFGKLHYNEACTNQATISCSSTDPNNRFINVYGIRPQGNCSLIQIGTTNFIFDPVMINYVWITLYNPAKACIANIANAAQSLSVTLSMPNNQEIVLLNVTALYYRFVVVPRGCTPSCSVNQISTNLETLLAFGNTPLYPIFNNLNIMSPFCLNNGILDTTYTGAGYRCICPVNNYLYGPACEYLETVITSPLIFFNIFENDTTINLRFSIFSNGIIGSMTLVTIKNSTFKSVFEFRIVESNIVLVIEGIQNTFLYPFDNQNWYDVSIVLTPLDVTFTINNISKNYIFKSQSAADLRSFYMIIYETNSSTSSVSVKNMITSQRVIDFNNLNYVSGCASRCQCSANQNCFCRPFESFKNYNCYCKLGYIPSGTTCVPNNIPSYQITNNTVALFSLNNVAMSTVSFAFQTLSVNGTPLTVTLTSPPAYVAIQIVNNQLLLNISNVISSPIAYNVSNGQLHNVTLNLKNYSTELILDNNYNYTRYVLNTATANVPITVGGFTIGPMQYPPVSVNNTPTSCFSVIRLNAIGSASVLDTFPSTNPLMSTVCTNGSSCGSGIVNCSGLANQVCLDSEWQNTKCICIANFTSVNSTCTYNQCINNPCLNNGTCFYNSSAGNFSCNCTSSFTGVTCSVSVATAILWWIAVLVVLILLLIVIVAVIVYCCCYRNRIPDTVPFISKINENVVVYNDQAGECDYNGPPIDFALMQNALKNNVMPMSNGTAKQLPNLMNKKDEFDKNNKDLILDHPLEYGYEGNDSDNESFSSIGSKSIGSQFDEIDEHNLNNIDDIIHT